MNRRGLLISAAAFFGASRWLKAEAADAPKTIERIQELPTGATLTPPSKLANLSQQAGMFEATLEAGTSTHEFVPGLATQVLAYNGSGLGAMIEVTEGDHVKINFKNRIPNQVSTIHWHGLDIPADQDGNPINPIASGSDRLYEFTIPEGSAGSYWYHPHPHELTSEQVYRGLAAPFIVRSKSDPLSAELGDTVLFISSVSLDADGKISGNTEADRFNGREGDHVLVNGSKQPVLTVAPGSSRRFRIYNATNGRFLRLALEGHDITLVGTDGGLISAPVKGLKELLLAPAERAEIVVDFKTEAGRFELTSMPYERGWMGSGKPPEQTLALMTFELAGSAVSPIARPEKLRSIDALGKPSGKKSISFTENMGMTNDAMTMDFMIDDKSFDMNRVDLSSHVGEIEQWEITNTTDMDHPLHIHGTQFQIIERKKEDKTVIAPFLAWKDTVNITSKETVRIKFKHTSSGLRMYHCHILEHEENGMMGTLNVV
jgi:FtsP/CotA-like multicopper oxidase with cupredoxin domain